MQSFASAGLSSLTGSGFIGLFGQNVVGTYVFSGLAGGLTQELMGGDFWQGAALGIMNAGLNHLRSGFYSNQEEGISSDNDLKKYVYSKFMKRLPKNVSIKWKIYDGDDGLCTSENILNSNEDLLVQVPRMFLNDPNGLLYDCIDHEIVHINDYASGRFSKWYNKYDLNTAVAISDFRAFSRNQWYSNNYRGGTYDYSKSINIAKMLLPVGWISN